MPTRKTRIPRQLGFRPKKLSELKAAVVAECKRRFLDFAKQPWTVDLERGFRREQFREMDATEQIARGVFARLRDALWETYDFVQAAKDRAGAKAPEGSPPDVVEHYRNAIGGDCASTLKNITDGSYQSLGLDLGSILFAPMAPNKDGTVPLEADGSLRRGPRNMFARNSPLAPDHSADRLKMNPRTALVEDLRPLCFERRHGSELPGWVFFGTGRLPDSSEIAVISLLLGNFPGGVKVGRVTVAEVIQAESASIRESRNRRDQAAHLLTAVPSLPPPGRDDLVGQSPPVAARADDEVSEDPIS